MLKMNIKWGETQSCQIQILIILTETDQIEIKVALLRRIEDM